MSTWEALIELDRSRPALTEQLVVGLRTAITVGRLTPGSRLPSSRGLAADLGLSRGVVVDAYEQLVAEGRLVSRQGSGTRVAELGSPARTGGVGTGGTASGAVGTGGAATGGVGTGGAATRGVGSGAVGRSGAAAGGGPVDHLADYWDPGWVPGPVLLRPGVPDLGLFPRVAWRRAYERALNATPDHGLDYGDPAGTPRLRAELADYLRRVRAARVEPDGLLVTTGAAQAFSLLARVLADRGETGFGIEDPGSAAIRGHLTAQGLRPVPVPVDADGVDVPALHRTGIRAVIVTPAHQFPTGVVLAPARRAELLDWARRTDALIIEDDYDAEFRYDRDPVGCLQGLAPDRVAHIGSTSKALAPAMRLGWLAVPPVLRGPVLRAKAAADLCGPALEQLAFAELLASGGYDRHLRRARRRYRQRRDVLVAAVRRHLPASRISGIAAGLHLVLELPAGADDVAVTRVAYAAGLAPVPLSRLRMRRPASDGQAAPGGSGGPAPATGPPGLVLGYAAGSPDELDRAVRTLATLIA